MTTTATAAPATPQFVTSGPFSRQTGLRQSRLQTLVKRGLPCVHLDARRYMFEPDVALPWLIENGYLTDPYREQIKRLVDAAPPLTAAQAARIKAVLAEVAAG